MEPISPPETTTQSTPQESEEVPASELLRRVRTGGSISHLRCVRAAVEGETCEKELVFAGCHFGRLRLAKAVFREAVAFKGCTLEDLRLDSVVFEKGVTFSNCEFVSMARFERVTSRGPFVLRNTRAREKVAFLGGEFEDRFDGWDSHFEGWIDFIKTKWSSAADFRSIHCAEGLVFKECHFQGDALFRGATVEKKFSFEGTKIDGNFDLAKGKFHDMTYLEDIEFGEKATLSFWHVIARAVLIRPRVIDGRLASEREGNLARAAEEYGILKNNYAGLNWFDDEDWAYYRFKRASRLEREKARAGGPVARLARAVEKFVFDWGCGYGTMPHRVLASAFLVIAFFALLLVGPILSGRVRSYDVTGVGTADAVLTSLVASTSAFVSGFDALGASVDGWPVLALTAEGLAGMLLLGLFIVSFSRKVIR